MICTTFYMPYEGKELSKNRLFRNGNRRHGMNPTAARWKADLAHAVHMWLLSEGVRGEVKPPLHIEIGAKFRDRAHACDTSNLIELICDSIQEGTNLDDKYYTVTTRIPTFGTLQPEIEIVVMIGGE